MITHQDLDRRSLEMHRLVVEKIRANPELFDRARRTLARWRIIVHSASQPYLIEWEKLMDAGMDVCLAFAVEESEHATAMRQSTPICGILTNQERLAFLKAWKKDFEARRNNS